MQRGYGVSALINPDFVGPLARAADDAGYHTFWMNDVSEANGLEQLIRAQAVTTRIRLGVGVLPVDRWDADSITAEIERLHLDPARLIVGLGAGRLHRGSLETTRRVAAELAKRLPCRIVIGALGPRMCRLAGSGADGVLLNWVTADAARKLSDLTRAGARDSGRPEPEIVAYIRTAADARSQERLRNEASTYEGYASYARHFRRMGATAIETAVNGSRTEIERRFAPFSDTVDELVARAIPADETLKDYRAVLDAARPDPEV